MPNKNISKYSFKKGQCGNPQGRPKGSTCITTHLRKLMEKEIPIPEDLKNELQESNTKLTASEIIALRLTIDAIKGKAHAVDTILDRLYGKVAQVVEQTAAYNVLPSIKINEKLY